MLSRPKVPVDPKTGSTVCLQTCADLGDLSCCYASKEEQEYDCLKIENYSSHIVCVPNDCLVSILQSFTCLCHYRLL